MSYPTKKPIKFGAIGTVAAVALGGILAVYIAPRVLDLFRPEVVEETSTVEPPKIETLEIVRPVPGEIVEAVVEPVPVVKAPAPVIPKPIEVDPEETRRAQAWLSAMHDIHARRAALIAERLKLQSTLQPIVDRTNQIDQECKPREQRIRLIKEEISTLLQERDALLQAYEVTGNSAIPGRVSRINNNIASGNDTMAALNTFAARKEYRDLVKQVRTLEKDDAILVRRGDGLRTELVRHLNPFDAAPEILAKAALEYFHQPTLPVDPALKAWNDFGVACTQMRLQNVDEAEKFLKSAIATAPNEATFRAVRGYWLLQRGDDDRALTDLTGALRDDPENWTVNYLFALYQCRKGSLAAAELHLRKCRDLDKNNSDGLVLLSLLKSASPDDKVRNAKFAKQFAEEALNVEKTPAVHFAMSAALAESGEFPEALKHAESAVATHAKNEAVDFYRQSFASFNDGKPMRIDWTTLDVWNRL